MKPKAVIVYKSRYGATTEYARLLSQILNIPAYETSKITDSKLDEYDIVIAGGSVYVGKIQVAKWMNEKKQILSRKEVFLFVVCGSPGINEAERAVMLSKNIDKSLINRADVTFLKGRMMKRNLSFIDNFLLRMGAALQKNAADRKRMLTDFDEVRKENLDDLVKKIKLLATLEPATN
ncbi:MAG: hypothetical protein JNK79_07310 [Chitinophagaceae bacterium]|nr:hypothetical protein [Chitinophagaceae bacterium]